MNFFLKHLRATRNGVTIMLLVQTILCLLGVVMVVIINTFINDDQDYAAIGSMMALMGVIFGGLLRGSGAPVRYRMAVSMGHTRRAYLLCDPIITAMNCVVGLAYAWVLSHLEVALYGLLYPGWECDFTMQEVYHWQWLLLIVVGVCLLDFCLGALQLRFGAKGFAAIWFPLCFSPMIVTNCLNAYRHGSTSLLAQIGRGLAFLVALLTPAMWAAVGVVVLLVLVVLSGFCYARAEVRT